MITIDLADPDLPAGPPPRDSLLPVAFLLVLIPLVLTFAIHQRTASLMVETLRFEQRLAGLAEAQTRAEAARRAAAEQRHGDAVAAVLLSDAQTTLDLVPRLAASLPAGIRLSALDVGPLEVRIAGTAVSAGALASWLAGLSAADPVWAWGDPELRQAPAAAGIEFEVRSPRAAPGSGTQIAGANSRLPRHDVLAASR